MLRIRRRRVYWKHLFFLCWYGYTQDADCTLENPVVLTDTNSVYQYGLGLVSQQTGANTAYYHADGLGSIRNLANASGRVIGAYGYDAFGAARSGTVFAGWLSVHASRSILPTENSTTVLTWELGRSAYW